MPKSDAYSQGVQYPALSDAPNIETQMQTLVNGVVPRVVMVFADANARAAALTGATKPTAGMITYLKAEDRYEARMADGSWQMLTPGPWKPFTIKNDMAAHSGSPGASLTNGVVQLRGRLRRLNNGQFSTGTTWELGTLSSAYRPSANMYFITPVEIGAGIYYGRTEILTDGSINVITPPGASSTTNGLKWTGLDGITYSV